MSAPAPFYTVALLYRRQSNSGKTVFFGTWNGLRLYVFECEEKKDGDPALELSVRAEDWNPKMGAVGKDGK